MEDTQLLETINSGFTNISSAFDAKLAELKESLPAPSADPDPKEEEEDKAELEQGKAIAGITKMEVWDIPVGQALVGGFTAVFASELIDGFMAAQANMTKGFVKLLGAGVAVKWGGKLLGSTGSKALAILLAYDGLRMIIPMDEWAHRLATALSGVIPTAGLGGKAGLRNVGGNGKKENYYAGLYA